MIITKTVDFRGLTSDCWMIQINGLSECERCEFLNTEDCGGKNIREKLLEDNKQTV